MSLLRLTVLLLPLLVTAALVAVLVVVLARRPTPPPSEAAQAARRHATTVNITAWVLALGFNPLLMIALPAISALGVAAVGGTWNAMLVGVYPAAIGLTFLGVQAVGERTWPRPAGPVRRAGLVHRRVADVAPRWLRLLVWSLAFATLATLAALGATAAADGRSVHVGGRSASPYPGLDFGIPLLIAVVALVVAAEAVLRLVAGRPAIVDADPDYDAASRRLSAHRVLRGAVLVLGGTLAGVLIVGGIALQNVEIRWVGAPMTLVGILVGLGSVVVAIIPAQPPLGGAAHPTGRPDVAVPAGHRTATSTAADATDLPS